MMTSPLSANAGSVAIRQVATEIAARRSREGESDIINVSIFVFAGGSILGERFAGVK
jgi:hypothetical protein